MLLNFPAELLGSILYHTLPDLTDLRWSGNDKAVCMLYTSPILQVNRLLRHVGLTIIDTRYVWVHVHLPEDMHVRLIMKLIARGLSIVPPWLEPHISSNAPKVHVQVTWGSERPQHEPTHDEKDCQAIILPYNFDMLLQLWNVIDSSSVRRTTTAMVKFWYANMSPNLEPCIRDLVSPTRVMLQVCHRLELWYEGSWSIPWASLLGVQLQTDMERCFTEWLDCAETLARNGYREEAGLLMLYGRSKLKYIDRRLTPNFSEFDQLSGTPAREYYESVLQPLNRVRHMFWYLNQGASLTFVRQYLKHGYEWYSKRDQKPSWLFPYPRANDWYGLSSSELVKWHCRRAIEVEAACDMKRKHPAGGDSLYQWSIRTEEIAKISLQQALVEVNIARLLNSEDECARQLELRYKKALSKREAVSARKKAKSHFVSLLTKGPRISDDTMEEEFQWEGDGRLFGASEAFDLMRHTLLSQESGNIQARWPSYAACLDSLILDCVQAPPPEIER